MADNHFSDWSSYCELVEGQSGASFRWDGPTTNRLNARYGFAKSLQSISLSGYAEETEKGYCSLLRLSLTWSAFELFMGLAGLKQREVFEMLNNYNQVEKLEEISAVNGHQDFYEFIKSKANTTHQTELTRDPCHEKFNLSYWVSSIRHILFHGELTPHAGGTNPKVCGEVCRILADFLMDVMDREFSKEVDEARAC